MAAEPGAAQTRPRTAVAPIAMIVPVLNEAGLMGELAAELVRAAERCEVVVVDGGSDDGSRAALERLAQPHRGGATAGLRVIAAERGRARQMNAGARATRA